MSEQAKRQQALRRAKRRGTRTKRTYRVLYSMPQRRAHYRSMTP